MSTLYDMGGMINPFYMDVKHHGHRCYDAAVYSVLYNQRQSQVFVNFKDVHPDGLLTWQGRKRNPEKGRARKMA